MDYKKIALLAFAVFVLTLFVEQTAGNCETDSLVSCGGGLYDTTYLLSRSSFTIYAPNELIAEGGCLELVTRNGNLKPGALEIDCPHCPTFGCHTLTRLNPETLVITEEIPGWKYICSQSTREPTSNGSSYSSYEWHLQFRCTSC